MIENLFSFKGDSSGAPPNTAFSLECVYGDRKAELLQEAQKKVELGEDDLVLVIDLKCNSA